MEVYRLARAPYAEPLTGRGAAVNGARWNSAGIELIYTAANRSLAMAEVAVHFTMATIPDDYIMLTIYVPDNISQARIQERDLPNYWNSFPYSGAVQKIGDKFVLDNSNCILQVPSAVTDGDFNFLINPKHPDFKGVKIIAKQKFPFDKRIFG